MTVIQRINPRRPKVQTPDGGNRIVLKGLSPKPAHPEPSKSLRATCEYHRWNMAVAYADRGVLDDHAREAVAAAALLADPKTGVIALVIGESSDDLATLGVDKIVVCTDASNLDFAPERDLALVAQLNETYRPKHIFFADDERGTGDLGRRLAAANRMSAVCNIAEINADTVRMPWNGGAQSATAPLPQLVLLARGTVDPNVPFLGQGARVDLQIPAGSQSAFRDLGHEPAAAATVALEEADRVVSAGNGVANLATLQALADCLDAAVGASRVVVDDGRLPRAKQIGASGKSVTANLYVAVGISGAVQHLQGIKECRHVIAINRDASAPIVKRAQLSIIGDAEDVMQALVTRIAQARAQREPPGDV